MKLSRATVIADIPGSDQLLLLQPWTQQVALLSREHAAALGLAPGCQKDALSNETQASEVLASQTLGNETLDVLRSAQLVVDSKQDDDALFAQAFADYLGELDQTPTQLIVVPTLGCNLRCSYCYQEAFEAENAGLMDQATLGALFEYLDRFHVQEVSKPYLTLFGGEPLLDRSQNRARLTELLAGARARGLEVAVVTNGYDLTAFADLLSSGPVRELQVTLDGPELVHDARRRHLSGAGTFQRVVSGIQAALDGKIPVNLRVVVDRDNLGALVELARFVEARGWLDLGEKRFKTQVGRNYELFGCAAGQEREKLLGRLELWAGYVQLARQNPELARFYRPRFHGIRHLSETGEFPPPNFDACPATKKEWAFGPDGFLYGCTATVGHPEFRLGTFAPEIWRDQAAIDRFRQRSVFTIPACAQCELAPVCGGGCAAVAWRNYRDTMAPDCRPVRELLGLGTSYYGLADASSAREGSAPSDSGR
jgi:uncharacterized protein